MGSLAAEARMWFIVVELFVLHAPANILRNLQVKRMVTWHTWWRDMLHRREILRFSKKKKKTNPSTQAGIFPQILTHMFMNQNLTIRFRCGTNPCTCRVVDLQFYKGEAVRHTHVVLASELPLRVQQRLTVTILMCGWTPACGRKGRKELKRSLPRHWEEGGSSMISSLGRSEASVERKESLSLAVRAPGYLTQEHRYWEGFNMWQGQARQTIRNISPAET